MATRCQHPGQRRWQEGGPASGSCRQKTTLGMGPAGPMGAAEPPHASRERTRKPRASADKTPNPDDSSSINKPPNTHAHTHTHTTPQSKRDAAGPLQSGDARRRRRASPAHGPAGHPLLRQSPCARREGGSGPRGFLGQCLDVVVSLVEGG